MSRKANKFFEINYCISCFAHSNIKVMTQEYFRAADRNLNFSQFLFTFFSEKVIYILCVYDQYNYELTL